MAARDVIAMEIGTGTARDLALADKVIAALRKAGYWLMGCRDEDEDCW